MRSNRCCSTCTVSGLGVDKASLQGTNFVLDIKCQRRILSARFSYP